MLFVIRVVKICTELLSVNFVSTKCDIAHQISKMRFCKQISKPEKKREKYRTVE